MGPPPSRRHTSWDRRRPGAPIPAVVRASRPHRRMGSATRTTFERLPATVPRPPSRRSYPGRGAGVSPAPSHGVSYSHDVRAATRNRSPAPVPALLSRPWCGRLARTVAWGQLLARRSSGYPQPFPGPRPGAPIPAVVRASRPHRRMGSATRTTFERLPATVPRSAVPAALPPGPPHWVERLYCSSSIACSVAPLAVKAQDGEKNLVPMTEALHK
ncbi:hypothetical protein J3R75_001165 [Oligosphaera ethanolica]|uniref:Uncharacterized protein n=1 Tax=Oligosphaera ethanolica TaxID=760260 RepID=A0AAE3VEY4_9BACT|nr:hypothetical protein [Oligosphaera ethanolica]